MLGKPSTLLLISTNEANECLTSNLFPSLSRLPGKPFDTSFTSPHLCPHSVAHQELTLFPSPSFPQILTGGKEILGGNQYNRRAKIFLGEQTWNRGMPASLQTQPVVRFFQTISSMSGIYVTAQEASRQADCILCP